jgi:hypothetical protein
VTDNDRLDWLTAVWTATDDDTTWTTHHEIVGGFFFRVDEARSADEVLADTNRWTNAELRSVRDEVEREIESRQCCNRAFVPRYRRTRVWSRGGYDLIVPDADVRVVRSLRSYTDATTYTAYTADELEQITASPSGVLTRTDGLTFPCGEVVVEYEHGWNRPPSDLLRAVLRRTRWYLGRTTAGAPDRATTFAAANAGTYSIAQPGRNGWITADADIDLLIRRYRFDSTTVA